MTNTNSSPPAARSSQGEADGAKYDAFLSYSSRNAEVALKIEDDLENFPLPGAMQRRLKRRHLNVFLDKSDLLGNQVTEALEKNLSRSRTLVVLCSPDSRTSEYVNTEISLFAAMEGERRIVPVLIGGGPNTDSRVKESDWAFPAALLEVLDNDPLGPDLRTAWKLERRKDKLARGSAWVQFVAQILDVDIDRFTDRIAKKEFRRKASLWSLVAIITTVLLVATLITMRERDVAREQRDLATSLNRQSTISRLVSDAKNMLNRLKPGGDAQALQQLLVANEVSDGQQLDNLFAPVIQRRQTSKILQTRAPAVNVALSPDGRTIAAGGSDGSIELFGADAQAGGVMLNRLAGQLTLRDVTALTFVDGGTRLITATADGTVDVWDVATRAWSRAIEKPPGEISATAISPDGQRVAYGGVDGTIQLRGTVPIAGDESEPTKSMPEQVNALAFSPDGRRLVAGYRNGFVQLQNPNGGPSGNAPLRVDRLTTVWGVAVTNDGRIAAGGWGDGASTLAVWIPGAAGEAKLVSCDAARECQQPGVWSVAFNADGNQLVSGGIDDTVRVWDVDANAVKPRGAPLGGHTDDAKGVTFSQDGATIVSAGTDRTLRLWVRPTGGPDDPLLRGYGDHPVQGATVALSRDGYKFAAGSTDGTLQVWSTADGSAVTKPRGVADGKLSGVAFGAHDDVATVAEDGDVHVWSAASGYGRSTFDRHVKGAQSVAFSSDGRLLAVGGVDTVQIWDLSTGAPTCPVPAFTGGVSTLAFANTSPSRIAYGTNTGLLAVVDCPSKSVLMTKEADTGDGRKIVSSVAFSPNDDQYVATAAMGDDVVRVWDVATKILVHELDGHDIDVVRIAFSSDGNYLVSGAYDDTVRVWNVKSGDPVGPPLFAFDDVTAVQVSSDDLRIIAIKTTRNPAPEPNSGRVMTWPGPAAWKSALCSKLTYNMNDDQWKDWVKLPSDDYVEACPRLPRAPNDGGP